MSQRVVRISFLVGAFPFFKQRTDIERSFEFFKSRKWTWTVTAVVLLVLVGGIIFTCVEPILRHEYDTAFWTIIGPVFFWGDRLALLSSSSS